MKYGLKAGVLLACVVLTVLSVLALGACSESATAVPSVGATPKAAASAVATTVAAPTTAPGKTTMTVGVGRELLYGSKDVTYLHWSMNVWESLTTLDGKLQPVPLLAESWTQAADKLSWTFKLRKDVKFQDGAPFDAKAVVTNIERLRKHPSVDALRSFGNLDRVEAVDSETVRFVHKTATPAFPAMITMFQSAMFSPASLDADGNITKPIGTGAYKLLEWKQGEYAVFEANADYRSGAPAIKKVTYRYIPDANTRVAALQAGEIDAIVDVGGVLPEQVAGVRKDGNIVISTQDVPTTHYMFFNTGKGTFQDIRLRQAASLAIDRSSVVKNAISGFGIPGKSVITPMASNWSAAGVAPTYDLEKAKSLVKEAASAGGVKAVLLVSSGHTGRWPYKSIAEIIQSELGKAGIAVEIRTVDGAAWSKALKAGEYDFSITPFTLLTGDPDYFFSAWMYSEGEMAKSRALGYRSAEVDRMILAAATEPDPQVRKTSYDKLQSIAAMDLPVTPLFHETSILAARKEVRNLTMDVQFRASIPAVTIEVTK